MPFVPQNEIPPFCDVCKNAITPSNPIRLFYAETWSEQNGMDYYLPQFVFCYPCHDKYEEEIVTNQFNPWDFLEL